MGLHVSVAADHAGFALKEEVRARLQDAHTIIDLGAYQYAPDDDYPDFALALAQSVASGQVRRGILLCGSGVGASIAANKVPGIRAGLCHDTYSARQGVEHDDMNVLCLGARVVGPELAFELINAFLQADFCREKRHQRRLHKLLDIEQQYLRQ